LVLVLPQEALADQLVSADDKLQTVDMVEVLTDVLRNRQRNSQHMPSVHTHHACRLIQQVMFNGLHMLHCGMSAAADGTHQQEPKGCQ
jgi:hypothetical protein